MKTKGIEKKILGRSNYKHKLEEERDKKEHNSYIPLFWEISLVIMLLFAGISVASATDYYVTLSGDDGNTGLSEGAAWRHIYYAAQASQAQAGDTVHIKSGNYGHEHVIISNSGTAENLIVFEGYDGIPVIDGQDNTGKGIHIVSKDYIVLRNLKVTRYQYGILLGNSDYITLNNITVTDLGGGGYDGWGIHLSSSNNCSIQNCTVIDAGAVNFQMDYSDYNLIENCTSYGIETTNPTDYYIVVTHGHDNVIRNCLSQNKHTSSTGHPGHGIGFKYDCYNNKVIDCETHGHGEHLWVAHYSYDNEFINCTAYNDNLNDYHQWNSGFVVRDGCYNNTYKNCRATGRLQSGASLSDGTETPEVTTQKNNIFLNCIIEGNLRVGAIFLGNAQDNVFKNCVINNAPYLFRIRGNSVGNTMKNSIVANVSSFKYTYSGATGNLDIIYSNFYNNGFDMPSGTGNMEVNPLFANSVNSDFHLKSQYGRWSGSAWVDDIVTSSCIDTGDPSDDYSNEPLPNGSRINMGAYGNTTEASKSYGEISTGTISGTVMNITSTPISGVTVQTNGYSNTTNSTGQYIISNVSIGNYTVTASKTGYFSESQENIQVLENQTITVNFQLTETLGLVGLWHFDEGNGTTTVDSSGNNNNGTLINMDPATDWVDGKIGYALDFDGSNDYVNCGNDTSLNITGNITIILWIKPIVAGEGGPNAGLVCKAESGVDWSWQLRYNTPGGGNYMGFHFNGNPEGSTWVSVQQNLSSEEWHHIAATYNGSNIKCYLNGSVKDTNQISAITGSNANLFIGQDGWNNTFNGTIDEVKIYDRALSADEIMADYELDNFLVPPDPTNLQHTTGDFWVNYTWDAGDGNITNGYNVTWNASWYNTSNDYMNKSVGASNWANITIWAWNSSGDGTISIGSISDNVQVSELPSWDSSFYSHRKQWIVTNVNATTLTNFPTYINVSDEPEMQASWNDVVFTDSDSNLIAYELENYTSDFADYWVNVTIPASSSVSGWIYYGNDSAISQENPEDVWNLSGKMIHHLQDLSDSTSYDNDGINYGSTYNENGIIDGSRDFDGVGNYIDCGEEASLDCTTAISIEAWIKIPSGIGHAYIVSKYNYSSNNRAYSLQSENFGVQEHKDVYDGTSFSGSSAGDLDDGQWHHLVGRWQSGGKAQLFVDGKLVGTANTSVTDIDIVTTPVWIARFTNAYSNCTIDEVRIYNQILSIDEINQSYEMVVNQSSWVSWGSAEGPTINYCIGTVKDKDTNNPIEGATITANGYSTTTNSTGKYTITLLMKSYTIIASKIEYQSQTKESVEVLENQTTTVDFQLTKKAIEKRSSKTEESLGEGILLGSILLLIFGGTIFITLIRREK